jgi:MFS family permease
MKKSIEEGLEIVGDNHKYQMSVAILLFFIGIMADIIYTGIPLMETSPIVDLEANGKIVHTAINYTICNQTYIINEKRSKSSWVYDYNIYCDKLLVSLLGSTIVLGGLIGSLILQYIKEKGTKFAIMLMCFIMYSSIVLLMFEKLEYLYIFLFLNGLSSLLIFILKINILTDITNTHYRSYYNNALMTAGSFSMMIIYFLFYLNISWKVVYFWNAILLFVFTIIFYKVYVESPRFYYAKNKKGKMLESLLYIARFNGTDQAMHFRERFEGFLTSLGIGELISLSSRSDEEEGLDNKSKTQGCINSSNPIEKNVQITNTIEVVTEVKYNKALYVNFIISYPLGAFLYFLYMIEIKEYSYYIKSMVFWFCIVSIISSLFLSHVMNYFGRKKTKIALLVMFLTFLVISKMIHQKSRDVKLYIYLINRLLLHSIVMVNHTHINESFPSSIRLKTFTLAHTTSKLAILIAPFVFEYFKIYNTYIIITISLLLIFAYFLQKETSHKSLEDV